MDEEQSGNRGGSLDFIDTSRKAPIRELVPLQIGGGYEIIRKIRFPDEIGARMCQDRRLHLSVQDLERFLEIARSSLTQRVTLHGVQVEVMQCRTPNGHIFESWSFAGYPTAEGSIKDSMVLADTGQVRRRAEDNER